MKANTMNHAPYHYFEFSNSMVYLAFVETFHLKVSLARKWLNIEIHTYFLSKTKAVDVQAIPESSCIKLDSWVQ